MNSRLLIAAVSSFALTVGAGAVIGASPATAAPVPTAATASFIATPNGLVGVQQQVSIKAPSLKGKTATVTFALAGGSSFSGQTAISSAGTGTLAWTPNLPGTWTITSAGAGSTTITVAAIPTTTTLFIPDEVGAGFATTILAQVSSLGGTIAPSGTVTVRNQSNQIVATGALTPGNSPLTSTVSLSWTPSPGAISLTGTFTPATSAFAASTSLTESPFVGANQTIAIEPPPTVYLGVPTTLRAITGSGVPGGSAAFNQTIDGFLTYLGGSNPVVNGVATYTWTPNVLGFITLGVEYASTDFSVNGRDFLQVRVLPAPTPDTITVTPAGAAAWGPGAVGALTAGNTVTLGAASASGNPVTLAASGACVINAAVATMTTGGTCTITAASLGNAGSLAASAQTYTIAVADAPVVKKPKPKKPKKPAKR